MKRKISDLLFLLSLTLVLSSCAPVIPDFVPFDTEAESKTDLVCEETETIPSLSLEGRRFAFSGGEDAISFEDDLLTVREAGVYRLTGELIEGGVRIAVGWGEVVRLILDGVSISSTRRPCLWVESAAAVILERSEGSVNRFHSEADAVIESETNLVLCGEGSLSLGGGEVAIRAEGTLWAEGGRLTAVASICGIHAKKRVELSGGAVAVSAAKTGVFSEGRILVSGASLSVLATEAALSATDGILLYGGKGSLDAPVLYQSEEILCTGGDFPPIPS